MRFIPSPSRMSLREISAPRSTITQRLEKIPGVCSWSQKLLEPEHLVTKQVSFFLGRTTLLTFQDAKQDIFEPVRHRMESSRSHVRANDVSFLLYVLLDYIVDEFFPILDQYAERIERLEHLVLTKPDRATLQNIHRIKRDLLMMRRVAWPTRELIRELTREYHECLSSNTATYLRDVHDHMLVVFEMVQSYHDFNFDVDGNLHVGGEQSHERDHEDAHDDQHHLCPVNFFGRGLRHEHAHPREQLLV